MAYLIYRATNKITEKSYIGFTGTSLKKRRQGHYYDALGGSKTHFHRALRKYSRGCWVWEILAACKERAQAGNLEMQYIAENKTFGKLGYNSTIGGEGANGYKHTKSAKCSISKALRDRSSESRMKAAKKIKGHTYWGPRIRTEESKEKQSQTFKQTVSCLSPEERSLKFGKFGEDNGFYQKTHTDETKDRMSAMRKGNYSGADNPFYQKQHSAESRALMSQNSNKKGKPVINKGEQGIFGWFTNEKEEQYLRIENAPSNWRRGRLKRRTT